MKSLYEFTLLQMSMCCCDCLLVYTCAVLGSAFNRKNGGKIDEETTDGGYTLTFQCRQEVLDDVMQKLNVIKDGIISVNVDLNKEFPLYSGKYCVDIFVFNL